MIEKTESILIIKVYLDWSLIKTGQPLPGVKDSGKAHFRVKSGEGRVENVIHVQVYPS